MKRITLGFAALCLGATPALAQSPKLWSVTDGDTTIYLFGSVHAMPGSPTWFDGAIRAAYDASDEIAVETVADPNAKDPAEARYAKSKVPLRRYLTAPQTAKLEASLAKIGANRSALDPYKPWYANFMMSIAAMSDSGFSAGSGVESVLRRSAERDLKEVTGMETREHQFSVIDSIPIAAQIRLLDMTISDPAAVKASARTRVRCWQAGDLACISDAIDREYQAVPEVREALIVRRSGVFSRWIADRMKRPGAVFVAVGLDHFVGQGSVIEQLAALGVVVAPVTAGHIDDHNTRTTATR